MAEGINSKMKKDQNDDKAKKVFSEDKKKNIEMPVETKNTEGEEKKIENNKSDDAIVKKESKKVVQKIAPKDKAIVNGYSLRISPKESKYVCKMIKNKTLDRAKEMLKNVIKMKQPVKMVMLEVPHQKGKGISGAKYPVNTSKDILLLVEQLESNCIVNQIDNPVIKVAMSNKASSYKKKGGKTSKRTHIYLEAVSKNKSSGNKK